MLKPEPGQLVGVRQRRYLVEDVVLPPELNQATLVRLSCVDDDAQGQLLEVLWERELDARVLSDDSWSRVSEKGFDPPALFAGYLRAEPGAGGGGEDGGGGRRSPGPE